LIKVCEAHSGYCFPWYPGNFIPLGASAKYHGYHHTKNSGNYGSQFVIWDTIFSNNDSYYDNWEKKEDKI